MDSKLSVPAQTTTEAIPSSHIIWSTVFHRRNWRAMLKVGLLIALLTYTSVRWPIQTFVWAVGFPLSVIASLFLHEVGHGVMAWALGLKVGRLFVVGSGRKIWKSPKGAFVVRSLIKRDLHFTDAGERIIRLGLETNGHSIIRWEYDMPTWKPFLVTATGPVVNLLCGLIALSLAFYPLVVVSAIYFVAALTWGVGSDGHQMWMMLNGKWGKTYE
jgi:Zn-dependent protease